ncbi:TPA: EpsG family protein, partial [Vibrio diabolicus]
LEYFNRYLSQVDYYRLEPLFGLYTEFIKFLGFSPSAYVSILSFSCFILQLLTFSYVCKENRLLAFMLLLFNSFALLTWSGIYKNGISIPFLILAFYALSNRNVLLSFTSVTIACLFHTSAIIYYPVLIYLS